jgi:hypothetical protein
MRMKFVCSLQLIFLFLGKLALLILIIPAICHADEYILIMSKEKSVCQNMLLLYNDDLKKYGEIQYAEHEEYMSIKWEQRKAFSFYNGIKDPTDVMMSIFDINNDGKEEIVIKWTGSLGGYPTDSIHIFSKDDMELFVSEFNFNVIRRQIGNIGIDEPFKNNSYDLTEMPPIQIIVLGKKNEIKYAMGRLFSFHPFKFKGKYYIEMRDDYDNPGGTKFLVIFQYLDNRKLKDVCYYLKMTNCSPDRRGEQ